MKATSFTKTSEIMKLESGNFSEILATLMNGAAYSFEMMASLKVGMAGFSEKLKTLKMETPGSPETLETPKMAAVDFFEYDGGNSWFLRNVTDPEDGDSRPLRDVGSYLTTRRHIPEHLHVRHSQNLKSHRTQ
jgi:hypothetical protein